jgi:hypothetical protein
MNTGLSNLDFLRSQILASSQAGDDSFDAKLTAVGLGVAAAFENYCNRKFTRLVGVQEIIPADRCQFLLSRYPLEVLTAVDLKVKESDGWVSQDLGNILSIDLANGIVNFTECGDVGPWYAQVRFTFTAGFFWNTLEPADTGYPTAQPDGSAALPPDLLDAWLLQVRKEWEAIDKLGTKITDVGSNTRNASESLAGLDFVPRVKDMLNQFVRYNLV